MRPRLFVFPLVVTGAAYLVPSLSTWLAPILQGAAPIPVDWLAVLTSQGPMAAVVFWLLFRLEQKLEKQTEALTSVSTNQTLMLALYQQLQETRRARVESEETPRKRRDA